ncbi:MAG TPA: aldo/keto reductase, partial [Phycisphaerae bacterium]|nr:aldo/keto reductase [Phycisphaerae bacterium]
NLNLVQCLTAVARRVGCSVGQLAIRWAIQQTGVTAAIVGVKRISQVDENAGAGDLNLPPEVMEEVDRLLAEQA